MKNFRLIYEPKNDLHKRSASLRVIIPQRLEVTGIAPARLSSSN